MTLTPGLSPCKTNRHSSYLDQLCKAIAIDGVKFTTYWAWSLWDNFEWRQAYTERFGMIYIDLQVWELCRRGVHA